MRKSNVLGFVVSALAVGVIFACGSSPKPDANTAPMPSATPSSMPSEMPSTEDAGATSTADAATTTASADAGMSKEKQCEQLQNDAQSELDAERIKVDTVCKKDSDCMPIKGRACLFTCTNGAIPKAEQKGWEKELAGVKDGSCKKWQEMDCGKDRKPPTCSDDKKKPVCEKGRCSLK